MLTSTVDTAVEATRLGAFDFVEKPLSIAKLLRTVEAALESAGRQAKAARNLLPSLLAPAGRSQIMQGLRERVQQYARHDGCVLISGEPGTGRSASGAGARHPAAPSPLAGLPAGRRRGGRCSGDRPLPGALAGSLAAAAGRAAGAADRAGVSSRAAVAGARARGTGAAAGGGGAAAGVPGAAAGGAAAALPVRATLTPC